MALLQYNKWIPIKEAIDFERLFVQGTPEQGLGMCQKAFKNGNASRKLVPCADKSDFIRISSQIKTAVKLLRWHRH